MSSPLFRGDLFTSELLRGSVQGGVGGSLLIFFSSIRWGRVEKKRNFEVFFQLKSAFNYQKALFPLDSNA